MHFKALIPHPGRAVFMSSTDSPALLNCAGAGAEELDYFTLLANSDPRVPFEALHVGALWAIEALEGGEPFKGATAVERRFPHVKKAAVDGTGKNARFVVESLQPALDARLPQPCDAQSVEAYLSSKSRDADREALGPALAHVVQKYRWNMREDRAERKRTSERRDSPQDESRNESPL